MSSFGGKIGNVVGLQSNAKQFTNGGPVGHMINGGRIMYNYVGPGMDGLQDCPNRKISWFVEGFFILRLIISDGCKGPGQQ